MSEQLTEAERDDVATAVGARTLIATVERIVAERVAREREAVLDAAGYAKRKRDEFSADRRDQIIEALSWWEDDSGRWGYDRAETVLRAHEIEWSGDLRATTQDGEAT